MNIGKFVLPARRCGAAAGNHAHCYIGKVCCLLLVRADYQAAPPGAAQKARGIAQALTRHRPISRLKLKVESRTRGGGRTKVASEAVDVAERIAPRLCDPKALSSGMEVLKVYKQKRKSKRM